MKISTLASLSLVALGCTAPSPSPSAGLATPAASAPVATAPVPTTEPAPVPGAHVRTLRDVTTNVVLALNGETVRCSALGYGVSELKVSVPDLAWLAHFEHRSGGEGLPCMTAGTCTDELTPNVFLDSSSGLVTVGLRVILTEHLAIDAVAHTCARGIEEEVKSTVLGHDFSHSRSGDYEAVSYELCAELAKL